MAYICELCGWTCESRVELHLHYVHTCYPTQQQQQMEQDSDSDSDSSSSDQEMED